MEIINIKIKKLGNDEIFEYGFKILIAYKKQTNSKKYKNLIGKNLVNYTADTKTNFCSIPRDSTINTN